MTNLKLLSFFLIAPMIFLTSCEKNPVAPIDEQNNVHSGEFDYNDPVYELEDLEALENPVLSDASVDMEFRELNFSAHAACKGQVPKGRLSNNRQNSGSIGFILNRLSLDSVQRTAVRGYFEEHCQCMDEHFTRIREIHREIIARANQRRLELQQAYRNGRIDKAEFDRKMRELLQKTRQHLKDHDERKRRIVAMNKCREELFEKITSILNADQLELWKRWLGK